jgi:hypothetical protein
MRRTGDGATLCRAPGSRARWRVAGRSPTAVRPYRPMAAYELSRMMAGAVFTARICRVTRVGIEPTTYGLKVRCSTN